jgi:hemerythrin-like domain-containing protein
MKIQSASTIGRTYAPVSTGSGIRTRTARDAIALLVEDHHEALTMLKMLSESSERAVQKREKTLAKVATTLWVQMQLEEEMFYAAFEGALSAADDEVRAYAARAEHESVKAALRRLEGCDPGSTQFRAIAKVLYELVRHHVAEDEQETFPRVRALFTPAQRLGLGARMAARKHELLVRRAPIQSNVSA